MKSPANRKQIPLLLLTGVLTLTLATLPTNPREERTTENCFSGQDIHTLVNVGKSIQENLLAGKEVSERTILCWMAAVQTHCATRNATPPEFSTARRVLEFQYDLMVGAFFRNPQVPARTGNAGLVLPTL